MSAIAMTTNTTVSKGRLVTSWIMSGIVILFMAMDSMGKFFKPTEVLDTTLELGFQTHHLNVMGILALVCIVLYSFPRTALLGAVLLTGYYGGVVATHVRLDNPLFTHILFSVYLAVLAWGGLWLRNPKLRALFPLQTK